MQKYYLQLGLSLLVLRACETDFKIIVHMYVMKLQYV